MTNANPVSHEAYTALTLSSIEDKVEIDLRSILFVKDVVCSFPEKVYNVTSDENENAKAEYSEVTVDTSVQIGAVSAELQNGIRKISKRCKTENIRLAVLREIDNVLKNQPEAKTVQWVLLAGIFC